MEKQISSIFKWIRIIGLTSLVLGTVLKSLYFYAIISEVPLLSNPLIILGCAILSMIFLLSNFAAEKKLYARFLDLGFSIFLIGCIFIFNHWPGGNIMLTISALLIPILISLIFLSSKDQRENVYLMNDLLTIIVILFVLVFYLISWLMHYNSILANF